MKLKDQVAIVTGATSGIGKSIALRFAEEGASVVVVGRSEERGNEVIDYITHQKGKAIFVQADLTDEVQAKTVVWKTMEKYGQIDVLVNNAGVVLPGSITETNKAEWDFIYKSNVLTTFLMCHFVLPKMIERKSGSVINISSEAGLKGLKNRAAYCTAKSALIGMTKAMAVDHSPLGIRVNCVCPGAVKTPLVNKVIESHPDPRAMEQELIDRRLLPFIGSPEDVANCVLYLASIEGQYMTGSIVSLDGGSTVK